MLYANASLSENNAVRLIGGSARVVSAQATKSSNRTAADLGHLTGTSLGCGMKGCTVRAVVLGPANWMVRELPRRRKRLRLYETLLVVRSIRAREAPGYK